MLFVLSTPILIVFLPFAEATNQVQPNVAFWIFYSLCCALTIAFALGAAHVLSVFLWKTDHDPDTHALPWMSAAMDVIGQVLLALAFLFAGLKGVGFTTEEREALPGNMNATASDTQHATLSDVASVTILSLLSETTRT